MRGVRRTLLKVQSFNLIQFGPKNLQGHESSSCYISSVPTLGKKRVWAAGGVSWLVSSCCHFSLIPEWAAVQRSDPWMLLGKSGAEGVPTVGGQVA